MYRTDLIKIVARKTKLSRATVRFVLGEAGYIIGEALANGEDVMLFGFGTFHTVEKPPATITDFKNGGMMEIESKKVIKFKPSELLKEKVR